MAIVLLVFVALLSLLSFHCKSTDKVLRGGNSLVISRLPVTQHFTVPPLLMKCQKTLECFFDRWLTTRLLNSCSTCRIVSFLVFQWVVSLLAVSFVGTARTRIESQFQTFLTEAEY